MSVKQNYFYSLLNTISGLLFPIVTFPYVARILMADGIGQVNFYLSIINYISMFAGLGIPTYAIREIARVKSNVKEMNQVAVEILLLHTFLTLLGYIVVGVVALTVAQVQVNLPLFLILSMNLFFIAIGCEWFYQGMEDFKYITIRGLIVKMLSVALLFVLVKDRSDLLYYGVYSVVGVVGGNIFNAFRLRKYIKFHLLELKELHPMRHLIPALRIFLLNVVASIYLQLDTVMLGFLKGNEAVGYYTGAIKLTKMLMGITSSLCVVLLPRLSNLVVENEREEFERLLRKALDYVITIAAPMSMGLVIMAPTLVYLFCGEGYVPVYEYPEKLEFLHAIWSGKIEGKPVVMVGHRKGNRDLLKFYWEDGAYHAEVIDHDCGPANAYGFHKGDKDYVIATNREINEIAMYEF